MTAICTYWEELLIGQENVIPKIGSSSNYTTAFSFFSFNEFCTFCNKKLTKMHTTRCIPKPHVTAVERNRALHSKENGLHHTAKKKKPGNKHS
jgi:hypothetical protein